MQADSVKLTDSELLMRFSRNGDESAFCELVQRYAGMVTSVCRQVTRTEHDAEDACQATFLVLSQQGSRLMKVTSFGGWLHRVAYRIAVRSAQLNLRRRESSLYDEATITVDAEATDDPFRDVHLKEVQSVLHDELHRLPSGYRDAIVLCDLLGYKRADAALELDCTEASIKAALARGRRRLRMRLLKRGIALSVAVGVSAATIKHLQTNLSGRAVDSLSRACVRHTDIDNSAGSASPTEAASPASLTLARKGIQMATVESLVKPAIAICVALLLTVPSVGLLSRAFAQPPSADEKTITLDNAQPAETDQTSVQVALANENPEEPNGLAKLESERIKTLEELVLQQEVGLESGKVPLESLVNAKSRLLKAKLDSAKSPKARLHVLRDQIANLTVLETRQKNLFESGAADAATYLLSKSARLTAEIELAREQLKQQATTIQLPDVGGTEVGQNTSNPIPPASNAAVVPGESLLVECAADSNLDRRTVVQADHTITMPLVGTISVKGLTVDQVQVALIQAMAKYYKDPGVYVCRESASTPIHAARP